MFLFRPKRPAAGEPAEAIAHESRAGVSPFDEVLPPLGAAGVGPRSAAEWALGELLIRLCNRGRALRPESPEPPPG